MKEHTTDDRQDYNAVPITSFLIKQPPDSYVGSPFHVHLRRTISINIFLRGMGVGFT